MPPEPIFSSSRKRLLSSVPITAAYFGLPVAVWVRYFTDPACPVSWGEEPTVRRLMVEFGDSLDWPS